MKKAKRHLVPQSVVRQGTLTMCGRNGYALAVSRHDAVTTAPEMVTCRICKGVLGRTSPRGRTLP